MASSVILAGVGIAAISYVGKNLAKHLPIMVNGASQAMKILSKIDVVNSKYYKGGFEPKMTKREACLILGVSPTADATKIKDAYKRIILLNHPDRGGSPYIALKVNEAKDFMIKK